MSEMQVSSREISLVKQKNLIVYAKIEIMNRDEKTLGIINGRFISGNLSIESNDDIKRTASIVIETEDDKVVVPAESVSIDLQLDFFANYYLRLWCGLEDNNTSVIHWYKQGVFLVNNHSFNFDANSRQLTVSLVDRMAELDGTHRGALHAYESVAKNSQRIDTLMENVLKLVGIETYNITPISVLRPTDNGVDDKASSEDYYIPYDLKFSTGVTAYEILHKAVTLYPYYEMGFDVDGIFYCRKKLLEADDSFVVIDATTIRDLVISESRSIDWTQVKNIVEVWGKDGKYYGEAQDVNPESPFQIHGCPEMRFVATSNNDGIDVNSICDRYIDENLAVTLEEEQAKIEADIARLQIIKEPTEEEQKKLREAKLKLEQNKTHQDANVDIKGNDLAKQYAKYLLYHKTRIQDVLTLQTIIMPFLNDVDFKISFRSYADNKVRTYVVTGVSHDFASCTTNLNCIVFYDDMCSNLWDALDTPVVNNYFVSGMSIIINVNPVPNAELYYLYMDGRKVATSTSNVISYTAPSFQEGSHILCVIAAADYYRQSSASDGITVSLSIDTAIVTDSSEMLVTDVDDIIIADEEG